MTFAFYFCGPSCESYKYLNTNCDTFVWHSSGKASKRFSKGEQTMSTNPPTPGPAGQMAQEYTLLFMGHYSPNFFPLGSRKAISFS